MRLRTANNNRRQSDRVRVVAEARAYDEKRMTRLFKSGRLDKRVNSGFVRRTKKKGVFLKTLKCYLRSPLY
jgi:hypothetical protein